MLEQQENINNEKQSQAEKGRGNPNIKDYAHMGGLAREGTKNKKTLAKEEAWKTYEQTMVDSLWAITKAQLIIALGSHMIFRIDSVKDKKGKVYRKKPIRIRDEWEITHFVEMLVNGELNNEDDDVYYFATAIDPDTRAITDILDRLNGKPKQSNDITSGGEKIATVINIIKPDDNNQL